MRLREPLDDLFATGSHIRVLRALDRLPRGFGASGRAVARRAAVSQPTARQVLGSLERQGVVTVARSLRRDSYQLNSEHVLVPLIRALFERERTAADEVSNSVAAVLRGLPGISSAVLFGSAARGDMRPDSDIDVAVDSRGSIPDEVPELEPLERRFGNRINVIRIRRRGAAGLRERIRAEGKPLPLRHRGRRS